MRFIASVCSLSLVVCSRSLCVVCCGLTFVVCCLMFSYLLFFFAARNVLFVDCRCWLCGLLSFVSCVLFDVFGLCCFFIVVCCVVCFVGFACRL